MLPTALQAARGRLEVGVRLRDVWVRPKLNEVSSRTNAHLLAAAHAPVLVGKLRLCTVLRDWGPCNLNLGIRFELAMR